MRFVWKRNAFWHKTAGVLAQNGGRFDTKRKAFWHKMEGVLAQNGRRFGTKWKAFWHKTENAYAQYALRNMNKEQKKYYQRYYIFGQIEEADQKGQRRELKRVEISIIKKRKPSEVIWLPLLI